jgi:hypothetical protein
MDFSLASQNPDWSTFDGIDFPISQRNLSRAIDLASYDNILREATEPRQKVIALSSSMAHAGDWLSVIPSTALNLNFHDSDFRHCLQYWLGARMFPSSYACPSFSGTCDIFGDHHIECGGNRDRIHRHDSLRDVLFSSAQTAAMCPRKEVTSLIPSSKSRPAYIYIPSWTHGKPAAMDVSVISPTQQLTIQSSSTTQGYAITIGEERKRRAHEQPCQAAGVSFVPLIVETLGGWSSSALHTISSIGRQLGQRCGVDPHESTHHLYQRLSVSLWRGNAAMWSARSPTTPPAIDGLL